MGSKIEVWLWNGTGFAPVSATYVLTKLVASPTNFKMVYDVSNYIREYIRQVDAEWIYPTTLDYRYCNVKIKRYNQNTDTTYTLLDTIEYYATDGYHKSGFGADFYGVDSLNGTEIFIGQNLFIGSINSDCDIYRIPVINGDGYYLVTGVQGSEVTHTYNIEGDEPQYVNFGYAYDYISVYNPSDELLYTFNFQAETLDCNDRVRLYYVNSKGFIQSTCLNGTFKLSIETNSNEYQLYEQFYNGVNAYSIYPEKQQFNKNGIHKFTINTNWKPESWNVVLQEIMLSEQVCINPNSSLSQELAGVYERYQNYILPELQFMPFPVKLNTTQTQLFRHINDKLINYQLEFEYLKALVYTNM